MAIQVCKKLCGDCPFSNKSMKGFLGEYTVEDIQCFMHASVLFPCHKHLEGDVGISDVSKKVQAGLVPLCRGYVECFKKSFNSPRDPDLAMIVDATGRLPMSEDSMSMMQFCQHHEGE